MGVRISRPPPLNQRLAAHAPRARGRSKARKCARTVSELAEPSGPERGRRNDLPEGRRGDSGSPVRLSPTASLWVAFEVIDPLQVDGEFEERGRWELPLCVGLHYFDVMVSAALYQGVTYHLWLYYFRPFAERITRNYSPIPMLVDRDEEVPGRYAFLAYEMIDRLLSWLLAIRDLPVDQRNIKLEAESLSHDNASIPKSSILALGDCLRIFLEAAAMPSRFRRSLAKACYSAYFRVRRECRRDDYARVLLMSIRSGGPSAAKAPSEEYRDQLAGAWEEFDKIPECDEHLTDLEASLFR
jgi:hypothetical protein